MAYTEAGHSRLLKFVLPSSQLYNMADNYIVKFEYTNPTNVEASVPGEQKLREAPETANHNDASDENSASTNENDSSTFSPVYTVTKNEVGFTKGDIKLQKVSVTEDIAESQMNEIQIPYTVVNPFYSDVCGEVIPGPQILRKANGFQENEDKASKEDRPQTRIPKFRQSVERVRRERKESKEKSDETPSTHKNTRRTSIPRLKQTKLPASENISEKQENKQKHTEISEVDPENLKTERQHINGGRKKNLKSESNVPVRVKARPLLKSLTPVTLHKENDVFPAEDENGKDHTYKTNHKADTETKSSNNEIDTVQPEEEFNKIYEEIVDNTPTESVIDSIIIDNIDDPEELEMSFEGIIHDYEENEIEPIDVTKRKLSKQQSLHDDDKPKLKERRYSLKGNDDDEKSLNEKDLNPENVSEPAIQTTTHIPIRSKLQSQNKDIEDNNVKLQNKEENYTTNEENNNNETDKQINSNTENKNLDPGNNSRPLITNELSVPKEFVQVATPVNVNYSSKPRDSPNESNYSQNESSKNSDCKVDNMNKTDINNILNEDKSSIPESSKLVQNILSNKDHPPQSFERPESFDECTEIARNNVTYKVNRTDDDSSNKIENQPRRRSLKSRIAVLIRNRSMDAKDKIDKGDLYPKNTDKSNDAPEHVADKDNELNVDNKHQILTNNSSQLPEKFSDEHEKQISLSTKNAAQTLPSKNMQSTEVFSRPNTQSPKNLEENKIYPDNSHHNSENLAEQETIQYSSNAEAKENKDISNQKPNFNEDDASSVSTVESRVNKIISRLDSRQDTTKPTVDIETEIPVKKSVSSKIAMFERQVSKESESSPVILRKKTENKFKPKIISEVLKPVIQNAPKPNELRVENIKRESIIIEDDIDNSYVETNFVNGKELELVSEAKRTQTENTHLENRSSQKDPNKMNENLKTSAINTDITVQKNSNTDQIENTSRTEASETPYLGNTKEDNNITKADNKTDFVEKLDTPVTSKQKSTLTPSKSETHLPLYRREKSIIEERLKILNSRTEEKTKMKSSKSVAELDLGDAIKGNVHRIIVRINSREDLLEVQKKPAISARERPKTRTVSERIALFEKKSTLISLGDPETTAPRKPIVIPTTSRMTSVFTEKPDRTTEVALQETTKNNVIITTTTTSKPNNNETSANHTSYSEEEYLKRIEDLVNAKTKYGRAEKMAYLKLNNELEMPVLSLGTALMNERLLRYIIGAAIDMGYRGIDAAYIYGNEKAVGDAIREKISDGTVTRRDLFITNKLWSTFHRRDLVEEACRASLQAMGLDYFDLYLIHNPMSFKEGGSPIPKIANVLQYSESDFLDAWYGMEGLVSKGLVKSIGVSNFNAAQVTRVAEKARIKPVINQVECHPYLTQINLENTCKDLGIKLSCFGILGSKGTPADLKSHMTPVIEDPLVKVMAAGLNVTSAQLLVRYQIQHGRALVTKASSAAHLWDILGSLNFNVTTTEMDALDALNKNKRTYTFKGMGDTHRNYPFKAAY